MRHKLYFIFICLVPVLLEAHSFKIGLFELKPVEGGVSVFVRFDRADILKAMESTCGNYNELDLCLEDYLNDHLSLAFNGERSQIRHIKHTFTEEFIEVDLMAEVSPVKFSKIEIFNNCLLEFEERQENIVYLFFNDSKRSFRMNKDRIKTEAFY